MKHIKGYRLFESVTDTAEKILKDAQEEALIRQEDKTLEEEALRRQEDKTLIEDIMSPLADSNYIESVRTEREYSSPGVGDKYKVTIEFSRYCIKRREECASGFSRNGYAISLDEINDYWKDIMDNLNTLKNYRFNSSISRYATNGQEMIIRISRLPLNTSNFV